jgi:hypothetical protein
MSRDWPGTTSEGALLLHLDAVDYVFAPELLTLPECTLARKREFHVTVLGRAAGAAITAAVSADRLAAAWHEHDWRLKRTGVCRLLRRLQPAESGDRGIEAVTAWSVIETIELPAMNAFRLAVARLARTELPIAPPHVTLYVAGDPGGIGVPDHTALAALTARLLTPAEASEACGGHRQRD